MVALEIRYAAREREMREDKKKKEEMFFFLIFLMKFKQET